MNAAANAVPNESTGPSAAVKPATNLSAKAIHKQRVAAKAQRRREAALWVPDRSTPFRIEKLQLSSEPAQYVYHLGLVLAQRSLYFFYFTLPDTHDAVQAAEAIVTKKVNQVDDAISAEIARLQAVATSISADDLSGYTKPAELEVAIYTPEASRFATIVRKYDQMVLLTDALWFASHIKRQERGPIIFKYRQMILGLARQLYLLSRQAMNSVRKQQAQRELERFKRETRRQEVKSREGAPRPQPAAATPADTAATPDASTEPSEPDGKALIAPVEAEVAKLPAKKRRTKASLAKIDADAKADDEAAAAVA